MGLSLRVGVSWGWGLSRQVVDKDVPEFSRGMVSGVQYLRSKQPQHVIRIAFLATVMMEVQGWMNGAEIDQEFGRKHFLTPCLPMHTMFP